MDAIPVWKRGDDKRFELALVRFPEGSPDFLVNIAQFLQKPLKEVYYYYQALVDDVALIESCKYPLPKYPDDDYVSLPEATKSKTQSTGKKKGIPWSPEEHRLFLDGLNKYGKGDWKSISRECVTTRSPMQVASHAQKYFIRKKNKKGKRFSIHDMTLGDAENVTVPVSNLNSMGQQPHFDDHSPPDHYQHYCSQNNVTIPGSNMNFMGQQPHFGDQIPPGEYHPYSRDNVTVTGSNLNSIGQQPHFGDQISPDQYHRYLQGNFGLFDDDYDDGEDDGSLASFEQLYKA